VAAAVLATLAATVLAALVLATLATLPALLAAASWLLLLLTGLLSAALLAGLRIVRLLLVRILVSHHRLLRCCVLWRCFATRRGQRQIVKEGSSGPRNKPAIERANSRQTAVKWNCRKSGLELALPEISQAAKT
jgi:hypothetical protein